jgi:hypothetical protein
VIMPWESDTLTWRPGSRADIYADQRAGHLVRDPTARSTEGLRQPACQSVHTRGQVAFVGQVELALSGQCSACSLQGAGTVAFGKMCGEGGNLGHAPERELDERPGFRAIVLLDFVSRADAAARDERSVSSAMKRARGDANAFDFQVTGSVNGAQRTRGE